MTNPSIPGDGDSYKHVGVIDPALLCHHPHKSNRRCILTSSPQSKQRRAVIATSPVVISSFPPLPAVLPIYPGQMIQNMGCPHGLDASSPPQTFRVSRGGGGAVEAERGC
jgi:hypothetical protein